MMQIFRRPLFWTNLIAIFVASLLGGRVIFGWTNPGDAPPLGVPAITTIAGKIGISQTSPAVALHVGNDVFRVSTTTGLVGVGIAPTNSRVEIKSLGNSSLTSALSIFNSGMGALFFVRDDGAVGVGTVNPTARLSLSGGGVTIDGTPQAGIWNSRVPQNNTATAVDATSSFNSSSLTIAPDGLPVISYFDSGASQLNVAKCGNAGCTSGTTITRGVDAVGGAAILTSIAIGANGFPIVVHYDANGSRLRFVQCNNAACSSAAINTVDPSAPVGIGISATVGSDGLPVISYGNAGGGNLLVTKCNDPLCASVTVSTLVPGAVVGLTSIAISPDTFPIIVYGDQATGNLRVVKCGNAACSAGNTVSSVDTTGTVPRYPSLTIAPDGFAVISYADGATGNLRVAKCTNATCSAATLTTVDTGITAGFTSITIGQDGMPLVAYADGTASMLKVLKCGSATCGAGAAGALNVITTLVSADGPPATARQTSIAIGADGLPVISYINQGQLMVAHCGSSNCIPYWTRR